MQKPAQDEEQSLEEWLAANNFGDTYAMLADGADAFEGVSSLQVSSAHAAAPATVMDSERPCMRQGA